MLVSLAHSFLVLRLRAHRQAPYPLADEGVFGQVDGLGNLVGGLVDVPFAQRGKVKDILVARVRQDVVVKTVFDQTLLLRLLPALALLKQCVDGVQGSSGGSELLKGGVQI